MRLFFSLLSIVYISAIFLLPRSFLVEDISSFNPYSLLHVPLYGILTALLVFSLIPVTCPRNPLPRRLFLAGFIALAVALADEIHQLFIPGRDGSLTDFLLDMAGITLALFVLFRILRLTHETQTPHSPEPPLRH